MNCLRDDQEKSSCEEEGDEDEEDEADGEAKNEEEDEEDEDVNEGLEEIEGQQASQPFALKSNTADSLKETLFPCMPGQRKQTPPESTIKPAKSENVPPPMPLFDFSDDEEDVTPRTGLEYHLPPAPSFPVEDVELVKGLAWCLQDPKECKQLAEVFLAHEAEQVEGRSKTSNLIYNREAQMYHVGEITQDPEAENLGFNSFFESGNLLKAYKCNNPVKMQNMKDQAVQTYELWCQNDTFTAGHVQWFYFRVKNSVSQKGLRVRFNIVNMMKKNSLYNFGMRPCVRSEKSGGKWERGGESICWYRNHRTYQRRKGSKPKNFYTLTFIYTFHHEEDTVYFAHCFPYTYSDLQRDLLRICKKDEYSYCRRKLLCRSLAGNRCDLLTITSLTNEIQELSRRPGIIITSRVHPGETNSSFVMRGILNFLLSNTAEAQVLRDSFVFKIVPMLNPDGVIHGNYRCSLAGVDLNRRYRNPSHFHPTIRAVKDLIQQTKITRGVFLYLDLHGHSRKKNVFLYGCDSDMVSIDQRVFARVFPRMLSKEICKPFGNTLARSAWSKEMENCPKSTWGRIFLQRYPQHFSFRDCSFAVEKSKASTGRVVVHQEYGVANAFTLEASFSSLGCNNEQSLYCMKAEVLAGFLNGKYKAAQKALRMEQERREKEREEHRKNQANVSNFSNGIGHRWGPPPVTIDSAAFEEEQSTRQELRRVLNYVSHKLGRSKNTVSVEEVLDMLQSWDWCTQFATTDWQDVGQIVCLALVKYCNLIKEVEVEKLREEIRAHQSDDEEIRRFNRTHLPSHVSYSPMTSVLEAENNFSSPDGRCWQVQLVTGGQSDAAITQASVITESLAKEWCTRHPRALAEIEIRYALTKQQFDISRACQDLAESEGQKPKTTPGIKAAREKGEPSASSDADVSTETKATEENQPVTVTLPETFVPPEGSDMLMLSDIDLDFFDADSVSGSDSDPSADNMDPKKLAKNSRWKRLSERVQPDRECKQPKKKKASQPKKPKAKTKSKPESNSMSPVANGKNLEVTKTSTTSANRKKAALTRGISCSPRMLYYRRPAPTNTEPTIVYPNVGREFEKAIEFIPWKSQDQAADDKDLYTQKGVSRLDAEDSLHPRQKPELPQACPSPPLHKAPEGDVNMKEKNRSRSNIKLGKIELYDGGGTELLRNWAESQSTKVPRTTEPKTSESHSSNMMNITSKSLPSAFGGGGLEPFPGKHTADPLLERRSSERQNIPSLHLQPGSNWTKPPKSDRIDTAPDTFSKAKTVHSWVESQSRRINDNGSTDGKRALSADISQRPMNRLLQKFHNLDPTPNNSAMHSTKQEAPPPRIGTQSIQSLELGSFPSLNKKEVKQWSPSALRGTHSLQLMVPNVLRPHSSGTPKQKGLESILYCDRVQKNL